MPPDGRRPGRYLPPAAVPGLPWWAITDPSVQVVLEGAGWSPEHTFDPTEAVAYFNARGWTVFEAATDFMTHFFGLKPITRTAHVEFSWTCASPDPREVSAWVRASGTRLWPVGMVHQLHSLYIDAHGRLMALDEADLGLYDPDLNVARGQLFFEGGAPWTGTRVPMTSPVDELACPGEHPRQGRPKAVRRGDASGLPGTSS